MAKIYVLDTNVVLADFQAIYKFEDNVVALPFVVLEEVDDKKTRMDSVGFNARAFNKELDKLREIKPLHKGVPLDNGGELCVVLKATVDQVVEANFYNDKPDNQIIATAMILQHTTKNKVILVSRDANVRVKADSVGIAAEDYESDKVITAGDEQYSGYTVRESSPTEINFYRRGKPYDVRDFPEYSNPNHFVVLQNGSQEVPLIVKDEQAIQLYNYKEDEFVFGIKSRNIEQQMALELLLDPSIKLVTLRGKAGTGKTLLALAAALEQTLEGDRPYVKTLVARPIVPLGNDIGYLPGEMEEKLKPWMQPVYDNLEYLFNCRERKESLDKLLAGMQGELEVQALTYVRGRSIPDQFIIIDEAQNLTKHEAKTILTRAGENSKIVLMGDPEQIDHPYLDMYNNGLTYVIETFKNQPIAGHVTLTKGERSELAQLSADLL